MSHTHWKVCPKRKDPETGEEVVHEDRAKTVPATKGRLMVEEGDWHFLEEIEQPDTVRKAFGAVKETAANFPQGNAEAAKR